MDRLTKDQEATILLIIANVRILSELIHLVPPHRHKMKIYFKELFECVKKYEKNLTNFGGISPEAIAEQEIVYNELMEVYVTLIGEKE